MFRIAWDPSLPVVASQAFPIGDRTFRDGDPLPWREMGLLESDVFNMWRSGLVDHKNEAPTETEVDAATPPRRQKRTRQATPNAV